MTFRTSIHTSTGRNECENFLGICECMMNCLIYCKVAGSLNGSSSLSHCY